MWIQQQLPIVVLKEGATETKDKQAQRNNITAAEAVRRYDTGKLLSERHE
ncbi:MAG TPA: hypothetical protein VKA87_09005 [Nitrososphaeraceae archaeon]|jgi:hypothetical protein|nr:hypothetical protein [Nitrososphaeraceae archaeon]